VPLYTPVTNQFAGVLTDDQRVGAVHQATGNPHTRKKVSDLPPKLINRFLRKKLQYFLASKYNAPQISDEELTAILLSQSASLQSRPANPGQARNATQTSIGKANGHSRNIAAQNGLNGIASFDEHENGDSVREAKLQRHLKNMTEHEREKFLEELQNS